MEIILGTTSPYRREAFGFLGISFKAEGSDVDESVVERDDPETLVTILSRMKAEAVARRHPEAVVIGMDSVGYFDGRILEKPKSRKEAFDRLRALSGTGYKFYTGITMINTKTSRVIQRVVMTDIVMRELSDKEIDFYLDEDPSYNTYAHGYDPLGHSSSSFAKEIRGSYNNFLRGIPTEAMADMLKEIMS
ncbi:Maf family protein [Candidatus Woesearchaeota archaeon]|nr:Maf family protein [Candidatus Woesearchaeota archaeon]